MDTTFLNPSLFYAGLALASIPIIIHLLYRRKFRRIDWAPMHYLKLSIQRNRRRIRLEQLLLLLLRIAAVLLLFTLVARPVTHLRGLASWLGGTSGTSQLLLIDDSLSMDYRDSGRSALDRARDLAAEILRSVGPKDRFTLALASAPRRPLVREVELTDADELAALVTSIKPTATLVSWEAVFEAVEELVAGGTYPISELTVVTDLRRAGWDDQLTELGNRFAARRLKMRIFDVGTTRTGNVAVDDFQATSPLAVVGAPTTWEAVIRNGADREMTGLDATFTVDGKPSVVRLPTLEPGVAVSVPLVATFQEPGTHHVAIELPADDLPADNRRQAVAVVRDRVDLVLVDGEPSSERLAGEVDLLALSLALGVNEAEAFRIHVLTDSEWASLVNTPCDMLVLANVATLTADQAAQIERLVRGGMGLVIFVGDQIDAANYNQLLRRDGVGLLPAALETIAEEEVSGLVVEPEDSSPLVALLQLKAAVLERIKIHKHYQVRLPKDPAKENVRVLARWNNADAAPAVIEKMFGRGRVLLWTITADKQWSPWPLEPSYVMAMREATTRTVRSDMVSRQLMAGESIRWLLADGKKATSATIEIPDGDRPKPVTIEESHDAQTLAYTDTRHAGLYKLAWQEPSSTTREELLAVNPNHLESNLARIAAAELQKLWGAFKPEIISAASLADAPLAIRGREIWRPLAYALLGLLLIESALAAWTGRQR
jgi:hypothetical protein